MYYNRNYRNNNMGCCLFGLIAGIIGGIGFLLYRFFQLFWQMLPWIIKGLYYLIAWPVFGI
jgi:ABC-type antimicrobial peptide transport system permease subunit